MKKIFIITTFVLLAVLVSACSSTANKTQTIKNISPQEFNKIKDSSFVIDVHIPEQKHIAGTDAVIPFNKIEENKDKLPSDKDAPIAIYCRSGSMSAEASQTLKELGYTNIYNLEGGRNAYVEVYGGN